MDFDLEAVASDLVVDPKRRSGAFGGEALPTDRSQAKHFRFIKAACPAINLTLTDRTRGREKKLE